MQEKNVEWDVVNGLHSSKCEVILIVLDNLVIVAHSKCLLHLPYTPSFFY